MQACNPRTQHAAVHESGPGTPLPNRLAARCDREQSYIDRTDGVRAQGKGDPQLSCGFGCSRRAQSASACLQSEAITESVRSRGKHGTAFILGVVTAITTRVVTVIGRLITAELREVARDVRWLMTRESGWLRRW